MNETLDVLYIIVGFLIIIINNSVRSTVLGQTDRATTKKQYQIHRLTGKKTI